MERITVEKANYLSEKFDYKVFIIATDLDNGASFYKINDKVQIIDLKINYFEDYKKNLIKRIYNYKIKQKTHKEKLEVILNEINPDIVISVGSDEKKWLPNINKKSKKIREFHFGKNYRIQTANAFSKNFLLKMKAYIETFLEKYYLKKYDKVVVLTYEDFKKWNLENIKVIYNFPFFISEKKSELIAKKAISVGRLDAQKGYDLLIDSWSKVVEKNSEWILEIFGEGHDFFKLSEKIKKMKLEKKVILKGVTKDIEKEYLDSSLYIMTSRYEGLPLVLLEALACGLPAVSFDCQSGPKDIIKDGVTGFLVESNNILELAQKINILIENKELRVEMGKKTREDVRIRFNKEKIMCEWKELFESLVKMK